MFDIVSIERNDLDFFIGRKVLDIVCIAENRAIGFCTSKNIDFLI